MVLFPSHTFVFSYACTSKYCAEYSKGTVHKSQCSLISGHCPMTSNHLGPLGFPLCFPSSGVFWFPPDPPPLLCPENSLWTLRWGNFMSPLIHFPSHRDLFCIPLFIVWCPISSNNYLVCIVYIFSLCRKAFMVPLSWLETEILNSLDFSGPIMPNAVLIECLLNERVDETIIFAFPTSTLWDTLQSRDYWNQK